MIHGHTQLQRDTEKMNFRLYNLCTLYGYLSSFVAMSHKIQI